jgi:hypothetical protein
VPTIVLNTNELAPLIVVLITSRHGPHRKHRSSVAVFIDASAVIGEDHAENTVFQPVHWRMLGYVVTSPGFHD